MLNSKQKIFLRKYAQKNEILKFQIGKETLDNNVLRMLNNAITKHELIKVSFLKTSLINNEIEALILDISSSLNCDVVQIIGRTALFYRENKKLTNKIVF